MTVSKCDVLQTVLVHFLVFLSFNTFPVFDYFCVKFSPSATKYSILGNTALELFELVLDFLAFGLFLIKLCL